MKGSSESWGAIQVREVGGQDPGLEVTFGEIRVIWRPQKIWLCLFSKCKKPMMHCTCGKFDGSGKIVMA